MERKIGETFEFEGKWLKVKEEVGCDSCTGCYFFPMDCSNFRSFIGVCRDTKRSDSKGVVFEDITHELEEQPQEEPQEQAEQPQKLNLCDVLKYCPEGEPMLGDVKFYDIGQSVVIVRVEMENGETWVINADGTITIDKVKSPEIMLYPSRKQKDWTKVKYEKKKERFDPKTLKAFDRVIVYGKNEGWFCSIFSHIGEGEYPYNTASGNYAWCILYNDDTKHLVGTTDEAPDFYKYWED